MLPGPVFNLELLTTARRRRYYVARSVFGLILLYMLWQSYDRVERWGRMPGQGMSPRQLAGFALDTFWVLAAVQGLAVLVLTPVLFAGVIADEKQRRTLHYLLSSRLTSGEIVLGKLAARLLHVGVTLGVALPIVSLLTLLGGVPPALVVAADLVTFTSAVFLAGVSLLVSTYATKVREAILTVYLIELGWLVGLPLLRVTLRWVWPATYAWVEPVLEWAYSTTPVWTLWNAPTVQGVGALLEVVGWTVGLQLGAGAIFTGLAVVRLRPVFRRQSAESRPRDGRRALVPRLFPRPPIGGSPMLWKELHVGRSGRLVRWVARLVALGGLFLIGYWMLYLGLEAASELARNGYGTAQRARSAYNEFVRIVGALLYVFWSLGLAAAAASGISSEREEDTWVSLLTTPLEPAEIVLAKMAGALWSVRAVGVVLVIFWATGLVLGAVHPVGFAGAIVAGVIFSAFTVALGTLLSLRARTSTRATVMTVAILVFLNGGYLLCCFPMGWDTPLVGVGSTPFILGAIPISYDEFWEFISHEPSRRDLGEAALTCILSMLGYGVAACGLATVTIAKFDAAVDRPRSEPTGSSPGHADKPGGKLADDPALE
jgi:ABC-type transport system involved in multi-copper enzyme maturation permease subunit